MPNNNMTAQQKVLKARQSRMIENYQKENHQVPRGQSQPPEKRKRPGQGKKKPQQSQQSKGGNPVINKLKMIAKIEKIPKTVSDSMPFRGIMQNGIIETTPGNFTKSYRLEDINFTIAPDDEQLRICEEYKNFLNMFDQRTRIQFCIYNHQEDRRETIKKIKCHPSNDGLNIYRNELNGVLYDKLKKGNNSITTDKILTISVTDDDVAHAERTFQRIDAEVSSGLKKIIKKDTPPMTAEDRMKLLYNIYNQGGDYRFETGIYDGTPKFRLVDVVRQGLSVKDLIGPDGMSFLSNGKMFTLGDTFGEALFLEKMPAFLSTKFLNDVSSLQMDMLISMTSETLAPDVSQKLVKNQLANIEAQVADVNSKHLASGYMGALPPGLEQAQSAARDLLTDITGRNQNLFFMTFVIVVFAQSKEQLQECVRLVQDTAKGAYLCNLKPLRYQQEFALNTALPLCRNDLFVNTMQTTESEAIFIPFNSQELTQNNAIFYGLNQTSNRMIMYDRLTGANYNGLIFGYAGSGKSFIAKCEMISVLLNRHDSQIFVIDPQGEYYPLTDALNGQHIVLAPNSGNFINPLDLDLSSDDELDPVTMKTDFVISMFEIIIGQHQNLGPAHKTILERCVRELYEPYINSISHRTDGLTFVAKECPTLLDLYTLLSKKAVDDKNMAANDLAEYLGMYTAGSFNTFSRRTNVQTNSRFIVYDIKNLGTGMRELGLHICLNDVWNRMISNSKHNVYTWFYVDEFHLLLQSESTTVFLKQVWKMARKWKGVPTGIMQNTEDLLRDADSRAIVNNTSFVIMMKEPSMDRENLMTLFNLSNAQLQYITESDPGHGLLYSGKVALPFYYDFPKNTELYSIMTTAHDVENAKFK